METAKEITGFIRTYGIRKTWRIVSGTCWFTFPFILWWKIYQITGSWFFRGDVAFAGEIAFVVTIVWGVIFTRGLIKYDEKLMRKMEYARKAFEDPADKLAELKFRQECSQFVIPYLYHKAATVLGIGSLFGRTTKKTVAVVLGVFVGVYIAYSTFTLLLANRSYFIALYDWSVSIYPDLSRVLQFADNNQNLLAILIFALGFPAGIAYQLMSKPYLRLRKSTVLLMLVDVLHLHQMIGLVIYSVVTLPWILVRREKSLSYEPFIFPSNLHLILQQAAHNVGRKRVLVSLFSYSVRDEGDIAALKRYIWDEKSISFFQRLLADLAEEKDSVTLISCLEPELYLGISDDRCIFIGKVVFDVEKRVRRSEFSFDNDLLKKEFKLIADKEMDRRREVKESIPDNLLELIGKINKGKVSGDD